MSEDLQPFVDDLLVEQKKLDAHDKLVGAEIVAQQNLKTLDEAKQFAAAWIGTASQGLRNTEYMTGERDKLLALTLAVTSDLPDSAMTTAMAQIRAALEAKIKDGNLFFTISEQNKLIVDMYADLLQLHRDIAIVEGEDSDVCGLLRAGLDKIEKWCQFK